jgi:Ssp1 endopeptidase immunity protein Rap1a
MRVALALGVLFCSQPLSAADQDVVIKIGFLTGNQYRALSDDDQHIYAMGVVDGMFLSPFFGASKSKTLWIESCLTRMEDDQVVAIFHKYLEENPTRWRQSMNVLAYAALKKACAK